MVELAVRAAILIALTWGVFFLVMRWAVLWYWKIDRIVEALESIDESLRYLPAVQQGRIAKIAGEKARRVRAKGGTA